MTNKVIIDYTKCKYYQKGECEAEIDYNGNYCDYTCESDVMNDCYYKQLQRKTQECEKMKEESIYGYVGDLSNKLRAKVFKDLKEENQKYKSALEEIEEFCLVYRDNPVEGSAYKKILDIITKTKEQE